MKTALVTGGNAGIGKETARALVRQGYEVIIAARDQRKGKAVVQFIRNEFPRPNIEFWPLDLSRPREVTEFARRIRARWGHIDALVLNAGLFTRRLTTSEAGFEMMFATTHLGHFQLTHELLPLVLASEAGRIVVTSSLGHVFGGRFDFDTLRQPSTSTFFLLKPFLSYGRSKLANLLFVRELARRLGHTKVLVNAFHPGAVKTDIWRETPGLFNALIGPALIPEREGAQTQIFLATSPELDQSGAYWYRQSVHPGSAASRDPGLATRLWQYSEAALGIERFGEPMDDGAALPPMRRA
jgi:NAD(P)-dependent dehydrogenase (short-subunit alcohol dehydrogenase family)